MQNAANTQTETAADAFLNWVRDQEYRRSYATKRFRRPFYDADGETQAAAWINFFDTNIGMFLRNAAIYNYPGGMVQFYKDQGVIPQTPIATSSKSSVSVNVRQSPNSMIGATNVLYASSSPNLLDPTDLYGVINENPGDGSPYWLLVADASDRLVWMASAGLDIDTPTLNSLRDIWGEFDETLIAPDKPYSSSSDLDMIIGVSSNA